MKARRVEMLVEEFHKFAMLSPTEPIRELELRFTHLINNLASLGKDIPEEEQVSKILKVLKGDWITKSYHLAGSPRRVNQLYHCPVWFSGYEHCLLHL